MMKPLPFVAACGSAVLLLGAFWFQYYEGLAPCKLCIWQRYPHGVAIAIGVIALIWQRYWLYLIGGMAAGTSSGIGIYHVGIEQKWWEGPKTCTSGDISGLSADELFNQLMTAPITRCDEIAWAFGGISMAGWNAIFSLGMMALWFWAAKFHHSQALKI